MPVGDTEEVAAKTSKNVTMRTAMARFPFVKSLETFDFGYQPSIDKKQARIDHVLSHTSVAASLAASRAMR